MNSVEGSKGFITFLLLSTLVFTALFGFNYIHQNTNLISKASDDGVPMDIAIVDIQNDTATIKWATKSATGGSVVYSTSSSVCDAECKESPQTENATSHSVNISGLNSGTTYYYQVKQNGKYYPADTPMQFSTPTVQQETNIQQIDTPVTPDTTTDDFSGFGDAPSIGSVEGVSDEVPEAVFKSLSTRDLSAEETAKEFGEALMYQDLRKDFNHDGKVTNADWPLFLELIKQGALGE